MIKSPVDASYCFRGCYLIFTVQLTLHKMKFHCKRAKLMCP